MNMSNSLSSPLDRILELKDEVEKQKVELTPEVRAYIQANLERVQEKLRKGEAVTKEDMKFIGEVKLWVEMPDEWRKMAPSIKSMRLADEMKNVSVQDVHKRQISLQQWLDLLHVAKSLEKPKEWIDEHFQFPGNRKIETEYLDECNNASLTHLPDNLKVRGYLRFQQCPSLISLAENLEVGVYLDLTDCKSLTHLSTNLKVGAFVRINNCPSLIRLPKTLKVGGDLVLFECRSLTHFSENFEGTGDIIFQNSFGAPKTFKNKRDAEKFIKERKLEG